MYPANTMKEVPAYQEGLRAHTDQWVNPGTQPTPTVPLASRNNLTADFWAKVKPDDLFTVKPAFAEVIRMLPNRDPEQYIFTYREVSHATLAS